MPGVFPNCPTLPTGFRFHRFHVERFRRTAFQALDDVGPEGREFSVAQVLASFHYTSRSPSRITSLADA